MPNPPSGEQTRSEVFLCVCPDCGRDWLEGDEPHWRHRHFCDNKPVEGIEYKPASDLAALQAERNRIQGQLTDVGTDLGHARRSMQKQRDQVAALQSDLRIAREALEQIAIDRSGLGGQRAVAALHQLEAGQEQEG